MDGLAVDFDNAPANNAVAMISGGATSYSFSQNGNFAVAQAGAWGDGITANPVTLTSVSGNIDIPTGFLSGGVVNLNAGGGAVTLGSGATLSGAHGSTVNVGLGGTFTNNGLVQLGSSGFAGALNVTGNFVNGATGIIQADLGGTGAGQSDSIAVTGNVTMGGWLDAGLLAGYTPLNADAIPFLTMTGSASGTFTSNIPAGFSTAYNMAAGEAARLVYASGSGTRTFNNSQNNLDWDNDLNWTGGLPGVGDTALISGAFAVTHAYGTDAVAALTIDPANSLDVSGGSLAVSGAANVGGTLTVSGTGVLSLNGISDIANLGVDIGGTLNGTGALSVNNSFSRTGGNIGSGFTGLFIHQSFGNLDTGALTTSGYLSLYTVSGDVLFGGALSGSDVAILAGGNITANAPVTAAAGNVNMSTPVGGSIVLNDSITASTGLINLTSGTVTQGAASVVSAGHGLNVAADNISFGGTMVGACQSGGGCVGIAPYTSGRPIEIAGATANPNALSLTQADLAAINPAGSGILNGGWGVGNACSPVQSVLKAISAILPVCSLTCMARRLARMRAGR